MKMQSAIEFLSTYGFLFIVLAAVLAVVFFIASSNASDFSAQCTGFGGFSCGFASYYSNSTGLYSVSTMSLSNSQSVPLNISNFSTTIGQTTVNGLCTPAFVYPGETSVCASVFNGTTTPGSLVRGYYSVGAKFCDVGLGSLPQGNCTQPVTYNGAFISQSTIYQSIIFSVSVAQGNVGANIPAFSSLKPTYIPANYAFAQAGTWSVNDIGGNFAYSYGTPVYYGANYLYVNTVLFPSSTSLLNNVSACGASATPRISQASTTVYLYGRITAENIATSNSMEIFYKPEGSVTWNSVYGGAAWPGNGLAQYTGSASFGSGLYSIDPVWYTPCGQGVQALNLT